MKTKETRMATLDYAAFEAWLSSSGTSKRALEFSTGIKRELWNAWARGRRVGRKMRQRATEAGVPGTVFRAVVNA